MLFFTAHTRSVCGCVCKEEKKRCFLTWPGTGTVDSAATACIIQLYCIPCSVWLHIPLAQRHDFRLISWVDHHPTIHFWDNKDPSVYHTYKEKYLDRTSFKIVYCLKLAQRWPGRKGRSWSQRKSWKKGKANGTNIYIIWPNVIYIYIYIYEPSSLLVLGVSFCPISITGALLQTPKLYKLDVFNHGKVLSDMSRRICGRDNSLLIAWVYSHNTDTLWVLWLPTQNVHTWKHKFVRSESLQTQCNIHGRALSHFKGHKITHWHVLTAKTAPFVLLFLHYLCMFY